MNTWQLAEDFKTLFEADAAFDGKHFYAGQDAATFEAPALVFSVTEAPFSASGNASLFTLTLQVHGLSAPTDPPGPTPPDEAQSLMVAAVEDKLLGAGKADLLIALNALGRWDIRGWSAGAGDPTTAGMRFLTPVVIVGTILEI